MVPACSGNHVVIKQVLDDKTVWERCKYAAKKKIDGALVQLAILRRCEQRLGHVGRCLGNARLLASVRSSLLSGRPRRALGGELSGDGRESTRRLEGC